MIRDLECNFGSKRRSKGKPFDYSRILEKSKFKGGVWGRQFLQAK
jgi:hypothetical protein